MRTFRIRARRGGALLSVLWLTAALAAIALSVGALVRAEIERATGNYEGLQAYYAARAGIERFLFELERAPLPPETPPVALAGYMNRFGHLIRYRFPNGQVPERDVVVEILAESGKINLNRAQPPQIEALLLALGAAPDRAQLITAAILDWRGRPLNAGPASLTEFDSIYLARQPSFRAPHASFEEVEELLLVHGITPDLFYGGYRVAADGTFAPRPGLRDCFTASAGNETNVDLMSATAPVLTSFGVPLPVAEAFVAERPLFDIVPRERLEVVMQSMVPVPTLGRLVPMAGRTMYTIRATARVSGTVRSVSAMIQLMPRPGAFYDVLRWEDQALPPQNLFPEKTQ